VRCSRLVRVLVFEQLDLNLAAPTLEKFNFRGSKNIPLNNAVLLSQRRRDHPDAACDKFPQSFDGLTTESAQGLADHRAHVRRAPPSREGTRSVRPLPYSRIFATLSP